VYPERDITTAWENTVMGAQTALWLNRLGLLLDLLAFFLAAPESLGIREVHLGRFGGDHHGDVAHATRYRRAAALTTDHHTATRLAQEA
jgi:hypothetical protein